MGTYLVRGGKRIEGEFAVRGSKNAALPILAACVLAADEVVLENLPQIRDVSQTLEILRELGCSGYAGWGGTAVIDSRGYAGSPRFAAKPCEKCVPPSFFWGQCLAEAVRAGLRIPVAVRLANAR